MRTLQVLLVLTSVLPGWGCDGSSPDATGTIPPATFERVLIELSMARVEILPDTARYRQRRREVLERAGVTEEDLGDFLALHGGDADLMSEIYGRLGAGLDSTAQH